MAAMKQDEAKTAFNARAKASMQVYLKSRTWPEKIRSIERMNEAGKMAREAMRRALQKDVHGSGPDWELAANPRESGRPRR